MASTTLRDLGGPIRYGLIAFLVSFALLNAQVTVTRLLAYRFFYHFVFFVISLAQLGLAASGAWVYASRRESWPARHLALWLVGLAASPLAVLACYGWLSPEANLSFAKVDGTAAYMYLSAIALPLVALNFCGGMALTVMFTTFRERIGRLYAADLAGAAVGCVGSVAAMLMAGPIRALTVSGIAAIAAALLLIDPRGSNRRTIVGSACVLALLLAAAVWPRVFDPDVLHPGRQALIQRSNWNHIARVDSDKPGRYIIDGDASTDVAGFGDALQSPEFLLLRPKSDVAIIGVGAGPQLMATLAKGGVGSVLAIDINPTILRWAMELDSEANHGAFADPDVEVVVGEGRHVLRSSGRRFGLISMHAIDTWTASSQGAYSLSENFLYTTEAMQDYLARLEPGGVVSIRRWLFWPPRENLRLFTTIYDALRTNGIDDPSGHIVVLTPRRTLRQLTFRIWGYLLFSDQPFTQKQLGLLDQYVQAKDWAYLHRPGADAGTPFDEFVAAEDKAAFYRSYPYIVSPSRDSNPFFFQFALPWSDWIASQRVAKNIYRGSSTILALCLGLSIVLTLLLLGIPLFLRRADFASDSNRLASVVYFGCLGLGFMAFELPAIQVVTLFLGHPTYALSVVLLGLLAAAGLGSFLMGRIRVSLAPRVVVAVAGLALVSSIALLPLVHSLMHLPTWARFAATLGYLALIGIPLGMPFVAGIRSLDPDRPHQVAWAWAVNGAAAVVGTCLLMILMVYAGSSAAFLVATVSYLIALLAMRRLFLRASVPVVP